ncbi:MAG: hexosaminidase [Psychromonas sp.]|jgi:hexosaminidase|uniref:beta-N-acetylhexosaminidase n=1 Tax=Psychromonas sp. TaxID=1884585 RepID=UPI0039E4DE35
MFHKTLLTIAIAASVTACSATNNPQTDIDKLAKNLDINYTVLSNTGAPEGTDCKALGAEWAACNSVEMRIKNTGDAVSSMNWAIYLHSIRTILAVDNDQFTITHITGDLHKLEPTDKFDGFAAGEEVIVPITGEYWQLFETDFMPGAFITSPETQPRAIISLSDINDASTYVSEIKGDLYKRTAEDNNILATPNSRFEKNSNINQADVTLNIIPTANKITKMMGNADLSLGLNIISTDLDNGQLQAIQKRASLLNLSTAGGYDVTIKIDKKSFKKDIVKGAYKLDISPEQTTIVAADQAGAFYAMQSLFSLVSLDNRVIPALSIEDAPRFTYRGIMVDVARNFHSKEAIIATLDQMAAYKMNKLHLHLSDDEGWRIEIPGLPELTDVGAKRCFDESETTCLLPQLGSGHSTDNFGSGFFSRADFIEILSYAKNRNIDVIPEIDMPAHARAAVISMEARYQRLAKADDMEAANEYRLTDPNDTSNVTTTQFYNKQSFINPCMDSSSKFVTKVTSEVAAMYQEAGAELTTWHFGGDEAKNIKKGGGFQDINALEKISWKGDVDSAKEDLPFAKSPICSALVDSGKVDGVEELPGYFAVKVSEIVAKQGIQNFQAWEDGLKYAENSKAFATQNVHANFWETLFWGGATTAYAWAEKGYKMIISSPDYLYMDFPYEVDSKERGYYWATRATDTRKMFAFAPENLPQNAETSVDRDGNGFKAKGEVDGKPFLGLSTHLFSETVRTDEQYEYMVFPRVIAAAERAWHKASWENDYKAGVEYSLETNLVNKEALRSDWQRFANIMGQRELAKMEKAGVDYRLPVPGAKISNGQLQMNSQFPGITLQYSIDNGATWSNYRNAVKVSGEVSIRTISATGARTSRVTTVK